MALCCLVTPTSATVVYASLSGQGQPQPKPPKRKLPPVAKPSVYEIERAIGAGVFRDRDTSEDPQKDSVMDKVFSSTIGRTEGSVERRLRESGEWLSERTEGASRSSNAVRGVLGVLLIWVLPALLVSLFVATGTVKLPFRVPAIEDLIM